ncbi:MAG: 5'-nucleotidase C-terminal domain-containing protein [Chitinophagales bacterium]|nr:5'-nucleotidase C-terminal domain-containing protein [Chitinophagales bacterium]
MSLVRNGIIIITLALTSCDASTRISSIENKSHRVEGTEGLSNSRLDSFLKPYRLQLERTMNDTIAYSDQTLTKKKVESTLGNWVADGMMWYTSNNLSEKADVAICNYGGLRTKSLPSGPILLKHIFELMPFENELVLVDVDSNDFKIMLERIAQKDGWPVSKGFYLKLSDDNKILDWSVGGTRKPNYNIIVSDYIATGGDGMNVLIDKPHKNLNILIRDALISYARYQKNLQASIDGRIVKNKSNVDE